MVIACMPVEGNLQFLHSRLSKPVRLRRVGHDMYHAVPVQLQSCSALHYTPGAPTLASRSLEAIHQNDAPQIAQGEVVSCNYPPKFSLVN